MFQVLMPINRKSQIQLPENIRPSLIVVVDTEEEFDWLSEPSRHSVSVTAMEYIYRVQNIFDEYGIIPCYVVDYPIASNNSAISPLQQYFSEGRCEIGAQLHPWVNPPFEELVNVPNMYPGNLPYHLEFEKLSILKKQIFDSFGINPHIYKAGRYGLGNNTTQILERLQFDIDVSVCSAFDFSADGGPDYSSYSTEPFLFGSDNQILEIPLSGAVVGSLNKLAPHVYRYADYFNIFKSKAILSRMGLADRLLLSPEGYSTEEHKKLTKFLYNKGMRVFTWSFHSPSVLPGMTAYTSSEKKLGVFLDSFKRYFDFFLGELSGQFTNPTKLKSILCDNDK